MINVREISDEELDREYSRRVKLKQAEASLAIEEVRFKGLIKEAEGVIAELRERIRVLKD